MSILSDVEIKKLCSKPTFVLIKEVFEPDPVKLAWKTIHEPTYLSEEEIGKLLSSQDSKAYGRILSYEPYIGNSPSSNLPMIEPFVDHQVRYRVNPDPEKNTLRIVEGIEVRDEKIISYGLSSFGYDVRLCDEFKIFTNLNNISIDPLHFDDTCLHDHKGDYVIIPPNSYVLGKTIEYFCIPKDIMVICVGKSTYARCGAIVNVTPIEPGFEGHIVIEISNSTSLPLKIYANQGISQFIFFKGTTPCEVSYADRKGKYQGQTSIQLPIG